MARFGAREAEAVAALLRRAATEEVMPRFRRLAVGQVRAKTGPLDLVTDADEASERLIASGLAALFPGCLVVGEEATAADPALLDRIADADLAFVVDPVDGTANYAAGLPLFGVQAAAYVRGEVAAAVIHDPLGDDNAMVVRGEGAWLATGDGGRRTADLRVAAPVPLARCVGAVSWTWLPEPLRTRVASRLPRLAGAVHLRCGAHEYRMLAGGHAHLSLYWRLMPWDHAPGWLLHAEAGGYAARFDGHAYDSARHRDGGLLLAPDRATWEAARDLLLGEEEPPR